MVMVIVRLSWRASSSAGPEDYNTRARTSAIRMRNERIRATESHRTTRCAALVVVLHAILLFIVTTNVRASEAATARTVPVRLQLKWRHQFQFAGFYAALEKG